MTQKAGQPKGWNEDHLNRTSPGTAEAQLGTRLANLIDAHNALCAKLDADGTVTDTDYAAALAQPTLDEAVD
ncbi:MAG TPA: hypothetical protein VFM97_00110 [Gammaproteobacteria bacterium]|nr:hypothetical protein [Gammaproteobacteria bacterium]